MAAAEGARHALTSVGALRTMGRAVGRGELRERVGRKGEWDERVGGSMLDGAWEDVDENTLEGEEEGKPGVWEAWTNFVRQKGGYPFQTDVPPPQQQAVLPPSSHPESEKPTSASTSTPPPQQQDSTHPSLPRRPTNKRRKSRRHHNRRKSGAVGPRDVDGGVHEDNDEARAESALRGRAGEVVGGMLGMLGIGVGVGAGAGAGVGVGVGGRSS